jgi:hypothetical protein
MIAWPEGGLLGVGRAAAACAARAVWCVWLLAGAPAPRGQTPSPQVAWGPAIDGLQAALALESPQPAFVMGETIRCLFQVRNTSPRPIELDYVDPIGMHHAADVRDSRGGPAAVLPPGRWGGGRVHHATIQPGVTVTLARFDYCFRPAGWQGPVESTVIVAPPGRYTLRHWVLFQPPAGPAFRALWRGELVSGPLDLQVVAGDAAEPPPEADASSRTAIEVLRLLGDGLRDNIVRPRPQVGTGDDAGERREAWHARCRALDENAVRYLARLAAQFPDEAYREAACQALGASDAAAAPQLLLAALGDPSTPVRSMAARALGWLGASDRIARLLDMLEADPDPRARAAAGYALIDLGDPAAAARLAEALTGEVNGQVLEAIVQALAECGDRAILPALERFRSNADPRMRELAAHAIERIETDGFELEIRLDKESFMQDEPILVHWSIRNRNSEPMTLHWRTPDEAAVLFEAGPMGEAGALARAAALERMERPAPARKIVLDPLESKTVTVDLRQIGFFARPSVQPGRYSIKGVYAPRELYPPNELDNDSPDRVELRRVASPSITIRIEGFLNDVRPMAPVPTQRRRRDNRRPTVRTP